MNTKDIIESMVIEYLANEGSTQDIATVIGVSADDVREVMSKLTQDDNIKDITLEELNRQIKFAVNELIKLMKGIKNGN
jgi:DNA-binding Lrp family transcriptional regulator